MVVDIPASPDGIAPDQLAARRSLAISVAAMAVVMYVNAHPDVSAGLVIGFAAYALAFATFDRTALSTLLCFVRPSRDRTSMSHPWPGLWAEDAID
jgi:hypothetical protein